jgi:predicted nucleic acid-binding protein
VASDRVLVDAGPLVAIYRERDEHHHVCVEASRQLHAPQYTCWPVATEAAYLLKESPAAVQSLLGKIAAGDLVILPLTRDDAPAIGRIIETFHDQDTDFADACLVHLAEREAISTVFTVDRRHFTVYRTATGWALSLIPG